MLEQFSAFELAYMVAGAASVVCAYVSSRFAASGRHARYNYIWTAMFMMAAAVLFVATVRESNPPLVVRFEHPALSSR